jgi:hypothetical protein
MKWLWVLLVALNLLACAGVESEKKSKGPETDAAQVGVVNHTGNYIYSASVNGAGGGKMSAWGAGYANICCTSIPRTWYPGMKVRVRWNMPVGRTDVIKEKVVEVEKYEESGDIYLHFFPNDEVRVVVSNVAGYSSEHPISRPVKPANAQ